MHKLFLSLRYLRKRRIALFGAAAVMLCVALLIVITSLFSGFIESYHSYWRHRYGQIILFPPRPIHEHEKLAAQIELLDCVTRAMPIAETGGLLYLGRGNLRGVNLVGIDLDKKLADETFRTGLLLPADGHHKNGFNLSGTDRTKAKVWLERKYSRVIEESEMPVGVILGIGILARPDELTDEYDKEEIAAQLRERTTGLSITTGQTSSDSDELKVKKIQRTCWPVNVVQTGAHDIDTLNVYLPFDYMKMLTGTPGPDGKIRCHAVFQIYGKSGANSKKVISQVEQVWRKYARENLSWPKEWVNGVGIFESSQHPNVKILTHEIYKQLVIMQVIMGLICIVAALLVFVILFMMVMQKKRDMGIIRAVGASRMAIAGIFLSYGCAIGSVGALFGLALGIWATRNISLIESILAKLLGFKIWKSGVYMFSEIPNQVHWPSVAWIMAAGIASAVLGAALPAIRSARLQPVESLRYE